MLGEYVRVYLLVFDVLGYNYEFGNYVYDFEVGILVVMYGLEIYLKDVFDYWELVEVYLFVIGDFVWIGWDYLGEVFIGWIGYVLEWVGFVLFLWMLVYMGEIDVLG